MQRSKRITCVPPIVRVLVMGSLGVGSLAHCAADSSSSVSSDAGGVPVLDGGAKATEASCVDKVKNGQETEVDCGGTCKKCDGDSCAQPSECASSRCERNVCVAVGAKTCGAHESRLCGLNEACSADTDCVTDYCYKLRCNTPGPESHTDKRQNAGETDIDCGGAANVPCATGQKCKVPSDCVVNCVGNLCVEGNDHDGILNNGETDVDCGGANAARCPAGKACVVAADCGFGECTNAVCTVPSPSDGKRNGSETDVDCGGASITFGGVTIPAAPRCALTRACALDADCGSGTCASNKRCIEGPSCRAIHGGQTCGVGEYGTAGAKHESCCKVLPVPGVTMVQGGVSKQVYLDKYEITAGRIRAWIEDMVKTNGGDIQGWIKAKLAADPTLASYFPGAWADDLPKGATGPIKAFTDVVHGGGTVNLDMGINANLGEVSYYRDVLTTGLSGCSMRPGAFGHRTLMYDPANVAAEYQRPAGLRDILDEKSMNCITPIMVAAFCAWDGGYMQSQAAIAAAYGGAEWPWGATPDIDDNSAKLGNYNVNTGFNSSKAPRYLFPVVGYNTFANDLAPVIAAPGRFPGDIASVSRPNQESWMDLGGNMIEMSKGANKYYGWTGSSFEGHHHGPSWQWAMNYLDKYGKGGSRCMRLQ